MFKASKLCTSGWLLRWIFFFFNSGSAWSEVSTLACKGLESPRNCHVFGRNWYFLSPRWHEIDLIIWPNINNVKMVITAGKFL